MAGSEGAFDAVVVGSGAGGLTVAIGLVRFGRRVALVEAGRVGGDCTNVGCIPSKRLIHLARTGGRADPAAALADVRAMRDGLRRREEDELRGMEGLELVRGRARLLPGRRVVLDDGGELTAPHVVIATGSRPLPLDVPGLPADRLLTNETLFDLDDVPAHLAIVGAGPVGVEMACALALLGTRVTLIETEPRVLPRAEPEASEALATALGVHGVDVRLRTRATGYDPGPGDLLLEGPEGGARLAGVDRVLAAAGRLPNIEDVDGAVATGPGGVLVDRWGRASAPGVWAVGDVTPVAHQTHGANAHGRRIVQRIAIPWLPGVGGPPPVPSAVFTDPEVAWVGPTAAERARRCAPGALLELRADLADTDRGLTDDVRGGFVRISAVRLTGTVVAATVVGPRASELLPLLTYAVHRRVSLLRIQRMVHAYPTLAAAIGDVADRFASRTLPHLPRELLAYGRHRWARARTT